MHTTERQADLTRKADFANDLRRIEMAQRHGVSQSEVDAWIERQLFTLLNEHGPVDLRSTRQASFTYRFDKTNDTVEMWLDGAESFGDQLSSFKQVESDYPSVQTGMDRLVDLMLLAPEEAGLFWASPMKFYLEPRLETDEPSQQDMLYFYQVVEQSEIETVVEGQTIKLSGPLTVEQHKQLLNWLTRSSVFDGVTSLEAVVENPVVVEQPFVTLPNLYNLINNHFNGLDDFPIDLVGLDSEYEDVQRLIENTLAPYWASFYYLFNTGNIRGINLLIRNITKEINEKDAARLGLDPDWAWTRYLTRQAAMPHPLTGEETLQYWTGSGWVGGDACGGEQAKIEKRSKRKCKLCKKEFEGDNCPRCN